MSDIQYINTQEIRKDLVGFLKTLSTGQEVVVLNRSKPLVRLNVAQKPGPAKPTVPQMLKITDEIRNQATPVLNPNKSVKQLYRETIAQKYGIS